MPALRRVIDRPVAVSMLFLASVFAGLASVVRLPVELLPEIAYPALVVLTDYPGASPAEVERAVTERVEQAVAALPGVERTEAISRDGRSLVTVRFAWGSDMDFATLDLREQLDRLQGALPESAERPAVLRADPSAQPVMTLSITLRRERSEPRPFADSGDLAALREVADGLVRRRLEQIDGVARATVVGGAEREVRVDLDARTLQSRGLTLVDVARAVADADGGVAGGVVRRGASLLAFRASGALSSVEELRAVPVVGARGRAGRTALREVATVREVDREPRSAVRSDGRPAVGLLIFKDAGANTVLVAARVRAALAQLRSEHSGVDVAVSASEAGFISDSIGSVTQEVWLGGALAFLVLFVFLRDARFPLVIALAIPVSIAVTLACFDVAGVSLNIMSLGGLALGAGMLMDNSIVVVENIFRHRERGLAPAEAAARGALEVWRPVVASTLTTVAVFGPIVYIRGVAGRLFGTLALAVALSMLASVAVALLLVPTVAARVGREGAASGPRASRVRTTVGRLTTPPLDAVDRAFARFVLAYEFAVDLALSRRAVVLAGTAALIPAQLALAARLERSVLPTVEQGSVQARLRLPPGTPLPRTASVAADVERTLLRDAAVAAVFTRVGPRESVESVAADDRDGDNNATLDARLRTGASSEAAASRLRHKLAAQGVGVVLLEARRATAMGRLLGAGAADLSANVIGRDRELAALYARRLAERLARAPSLVNVRVAVAEESPELAIDVDPVRAAAYGLDAAAVAREVSATVGGVTATELPRFAGRIPVEVRLAEHRRNSGDALRELPIAGVPLRAVATVRRTAAAGELRRADRRPVATVLADVARGGLAPALGEVRAALQTLPPPEGIHVEVTGANEETHRAVSDLALAFAVAVLLVYMILAAEFESLLLPLIVLFSIPLGTAGAVAALWMTGAGLNTVSLIGIVVLAGIVDNDAVVKVDFIAQMRRRGMSVRDAIRAAGRARLRPILINTMTALLGLLPMALGIGPGAALQAPLAIAVLGGLVSGTLLTLVVIPVAYDVAEELRGRLRSLQPCSRPT